MYPVYHFTDSFPGQMNRMHSTPHHHHHHPRVDAIPVQMKADTERCPPYYQSWPSGGNYGYPYPAQYHTYCDHNYYPGYYVPRSPYVHAPPPCCHGSYPVPPGAYPVQYVPPPNYVMEPPRYSSEMPGYSHCLGCPNMTSISNLGKNVKIEEEDTNSEKKANDTMVPFDLKNHPYPLVWIPPGYMMNKSDNKGNESEPEEREKYCVASRAHERSKPSGQQQNLLNGWFPFDVEKSGLLNPSGDSTRKQQHQDEDKHQISFPLFWMPWKPDEIERKDSPTINIGDKSVHGKPSTLEITPVTVPDTEEKKSTPNVNEGINSHEHLKTAEKNSARKTVHVKPAEPTEEKKAPEINEEKMKSASSKKVNSSEERILSQTSGKNKTSSPPKSSKLPPVCLRVDPVRKKRNTNGGSRSPSPPGDEGNLRELTKESAQPPTSCKEISEPDMEVQGSMPGRTKDVEQSKRKLKIIEVVDGSSKKEETENLIITDPHERGLPINSYDANLVRQTNSESKEVLPDVAAGELNMKSSDAGKDDPGTVRCKSIDSRCLMDEGKVNTKVHESPAGNTKESAKISLSEAEAALVIQSAYRGYRVRRWDTLKKLKQIANIREEVGKLNNRIQALESCSDAQDQDKWTTMLGETIMNLLLKLDTIQGLHPSIRAVRKSVARELVSLQEKLDHLSLKKSESVHEQGSGAKSVEDMQIAESPCLQGGGAEEKALSESSPVDTDNVLEAYPEELSQGVAPIVTSNEYNFSSLDVPQMVKSTDDFGASSQEAVTEILGTTKTSGTETAPRDDSTNFACNGDQEVIHPVVEGAAYPVMDEISKLNQLEGLQKGVLNPDTKLQGDDLVLFDAGDDKALQGEVVWDNDVHVQELTELPRGVPVDDVEESDKRTILEQKDDEVVTDKMNVEDIGAEVQAGETINTDKAEQWQESMVNVQVISECNETSACNENVDNNVELCKKENLEPHEIPVEALEEDKSLISKLGDDSQMYHKIVPETDSEVLASYKNELDSCSAEAEGEELATPTEPIEVCEAEEQVLHELAATESETDNVSQKENESLALKGCKEAIAVAQDTEASTGLIKSWNAENEQKLLDETFEIEASGLATGIDKLSAQPCDSVALEADIVDQMESVALDATETGGEVPPSSPTASQISLGSNASTEHERKLFEENEKLRETMQKLIEAGKEQLTAISNLSGRVKDLEKKLSKKKKLKMRRHGATRYTSGLSCLKPSNDPLNEKPVSLTM